MSIIYALESQLKVQFMNEGTGHDWFHINRVRKIALSIQEKEGGDPFIIELAALLHDISDHKFNGGDFKKGALLTQDILQSYSIAEDIIATVATIVEHVSFKGSAEEDKIVSLEGKIVQDADRIDAIGAIGIARTFAYGGAIGQPIYDPNILPQKKQNLIDYTTNRTHTINHFYEKLLLLENRMHTNTGKIIAHNRTQFMHQFLSQFYKEWEV